MTCRERLTKVMSGEIPDCVPVAPDISNMVPARLTGKPFWQLYLYQDPPIWVAYIEAAKYFGFDALMDGYARIELPGEEAPPSSWEPVIVFQNEERIIVRSYDRETPEHARAWSSTVSVFYKADSPTHGVAFEKLGLPEKHTSFSRIEGVKTWPDGAERLSLAKKLMGDQGHVGVGVASSIVVGSVNAIYEYHDDPKKYEDMRDQKIVDGVRRVNRLCDLEDRPDFLCTGGSGTLIYQTPATFRKLGLPIVQAVTRAAKLRGVPTHIHSCGPETELVKMCAEETDLTIIDPLEIPPMGDCNLRELKQKYGNKLVLKGNLHTTNVMLRGSVRDVREASKRALDDAMAGGRFVLSTGDQCGRDTPDENIFAMIDTARTYGRY